MHPDYDPQSDPQSVELLPLAAPKSADDIRSEMVAEFANFKDQLLSYHAYAHRVTSLSVQYHDRRLTDAFAVSIEELTLLTVFNVADTPKTLDAKLAQMATIPNLKVKRIFFDRQKACYYVYV